MSQGKTYRLKNKKVFETLYREHWKKLYAICYSQTKNVQASEELVQDIFISLWNRWEDLVITSSLENYLIRAAKLKTIDYFRAVQRSKEVGDLAPEALDIRTTNTENETETIFLRDHMAHLIEQLPEKCQKVFLLSREQQLNTNEIALELGISQKTVKNHITKALTFLRQRKL